MTPRAAAGMAAAACLPTAPVLAFQPPASAPDCRLGGLLDELAARGGRFVRVDERLR